MAKSGNWSAPKLSTREDNVKARSAEKRRKRAEANPGANSGARGTVARKESSTDRILKQNQTREMTAKTSYRKAGGVVASPKATKRALAKGKRK